MKEKNLALGETFALVQMDLNASHHSSPSALTLFSLPTHPVCPMSNLIFSEQSLIYPELQRI